LASVEAGAPFTVFGSVNNTNAFPADGLRADVVGDPSTGTPSLNRWFNTDAFRAPAFFQFGNAARSILRGPGVVNFDTNLMKNFALTERFKFELRGELYNAMNHANFGLPAARAIQFAARITF